MDWAHAAKALLLGTIEGLTEFLPVSSTGHLIVIGDWLEFESGEGKVFEVVIQLGAILAVCWIYRGKIWRVLQGLRSADATEQRFAANVALAFIPAAALGAALIGPIKTLLFSPLTVAIALIVGGLVILAVERRTRVPQVHSTDEIRWRHALAIGLAQCFALIPGTSRSGSTIIGGMLSGLSRQTATEFSFFLAMPTMLGAALYDGYRHQHLLNGEVMVSIMLGFTAAFISALLVVRALVRFVAAHSFAVFAWYRIALGALILALMGAQAIG
jgi:undecaprenyl-diphosphatase